MSEHLTESSIGQEISAWCEHCHRHTRHRVDRVAVGSHAGKPGPCLEHHAPEFTKAQERRLEKKRAEQSQPALFEPGLIQAVGFRIKHTHCPKCGSENIEVIWRCTEPEIVSYECRECEQVTREVRA